MTIDRLLARGRPEAILIGTFLGGLALRALGRRWRAQLT